MTKLTLTPDGILATCRKCGTQVQTTVSVDLLNKWQSSGHLIQDIMPHVPLELRELFISGYCDECFHELFKEDK